MADVLSWCKKRGFDVDSPGFSFEKPNASGKTPLHVAVSDEKVDIVEEIVDHVKSLETRDNDQDTALLLACSTRNRYTTSVLLKKGAKVGVQDNYGNTPLHRVQSATGGTVVARLLLDSPGHPNIIDQTNIYDKTALHLACEMGNEPMVDVLLELGADPNYQGPAKCTPLHVAIDSRRVPIVKKLLEKGADTEIRDSSGRDAATTTRTTKRLPPEITKLVQHHTNQLRRPSYVKSLEPPSEQERKSSTSTGMASMDISVQKRESGFSLASHAKSLKLRLMSSSS
jgi:ankyrin repeat protein